MLSPPRSVVRQQSGRERLHFPVPGDFGYQDPVGRKKYNPKHSAIHNLIFNHETEGKVLKNVEPLLIENPEIQYEYSLGPKKTRSPITGLYSRPYDPELDKKVKAKNYR